MAIKTPEAITTHEQEIFFAQLPSYFNPDTPIKIGELFSGRKDQIIELLKVIYHPTGRHLIVYGERGVGKTSLVSVLPDFVKASQLAQRAIFHALISCSSGDTFDSVWKNMFSEITMPVVENGETVQKRISETLGDKILTPYLVQQQLGIISQNSTVVLVFDEFDTLENQETKRQFAETIKLLSDRGTKAVIILVGVGDSVLDLIDKHESIERNLSQVQMPRMQPNEAKEILTTKSLDKLHNGGMGIEQQALEKIIRIAQGLPTYIHALGLNAGLSAVGNLRRNVTLRDIDVALTKPVGQVHQSLVNAYRKATYSSKKNLFTETLLACALAKTDDSGYFSPASVREPFRAVTKKPRYDIPNFLPVMKGLTEESHGPALIKTGPAYGMQYRFTKALLRPFVIMQGLSSGKITDEELRKLTADPSDTLPLS